MNELKIYAGYIARELGIDSDIKEIRLKYSKGYYGYYGKKGPFQGFKLLWNNSKVTITFAGGYDVSQEIRKDFIVHELTHVRQLISGDLRPDGKTIKWKGRFNHTWKKFRFKELDQKVNDDAISEYILKLFPWEKEVQRNCNFYEDERKSKKGVSL